MTFHWDSELTKHPIAEFTFGVRQSLEHTKKSIAHSQQVLAELCARLKTTHGLFLAEYDSLPVQQRNHYLHLSLGQMINMFHILKSFKNDPSMDHLWDNCVDRISEFKLQCEASSWEQLSSNDQQDLVHVFFHSKEFVKLFSHIEEEVHELKKCKEIVDRIVR